MSKIIRTYIGFCSAILLFSGGCIKNDLPYPRIQQNITSISANGETRSAVIDSINLKATVYLDETVDIENVKFDRFSVTYGGEVTPDLSEGYYNLTSPLTVSITRYQTYEWEVSAVQSIERYFQIEGQIGESEIDEKERKIVVKVPDTLDLSSLEVSSVKLGPEGITSMMPDIKPGLYDFSSPLEIDVTCHGRTERWTIEVIPTKLLVSTASVDAWSMVVWAYGNCPSDMKGGFKYRKKGDADWADVPADYVTQTQGAFSCYIPHLVPLTEYEVKAVADGQDGNVVSVTTAATADIPDGSFDQWWLKNNKIWCPWDENGEQYWDTGNTGAATLGQSNVVPSDYTPDGAGQSAELNTKFVGIGPLGKLAAGSIYTGSFKKVDGTNGILDFGRPWTLRPTRLRGYFQYKTAPISHCIKEDPFQTMIGQPDTCHIYVALTDWTAPYEIRTNPKNRQLFDKDSPSVIAYGDLQYSGTMDGYKEFVIDIKYRSTSRVPSYILITCAASKYGDFFTGGQGAQLYVDQFSFDYDY